MLAAAEVLAAVPVRDDGSDGYTAHHIFCTSKTGVAYSYDDIVLLPGAGDQLAWHSGGVLAKVSRLSWA